ncbi:MAG TPA: non-canonical purine NTP pyrophosphatase [Candidatus Krumholzibacteria bacterium]|nr:non-canonical purine NTP pyrophosphatase [Candidatus Krumholzibacteria bacterium]HPD71014.1 non-canonical purine NTP pyrophosphatase [Candidatus Krumholzibacteria bacterium]HRY39286.1 non-canonical purine NTP pyrophosphatase [Candidatus Krumholzibacteria bacterium]
MGVTARTVVLASRNEDKLRELRELCAGLPLRVTSLADYPEAPEVIEDGTTALGNAARKALVAAAYTGEIAVADDTSLQIRALGDMPGIFASRFAGPAATYADNVALALALMDGVPNDAREARFEAGIVWIDPRPDPDLAPAAAAPAAQRWLHNPFARSIALAPDEDEDAFWNELSDRRRIWHDYHAWIRTVPSGGGTDRERLVQTIDRLVAPFLDGRRPAGAPLAAISLPDPGLWTADGPTGGDPPTLVAPSGLPPDAPGRAVNAPHWLELAAAGRLLGRLGREPRGVRGFGYDPIFIPAGGERTLAELAPDEKHAISHRGLAMRRLLAAVSRVYGAR